MPVFKSFVRPAALFAILAALALSPPVARADDGLNYSSETLSNGLQVVYAPMPNCPVTHVRVLYHVGSKDETPNRQGFAHMFEHMMFRGSAHVKPQEHMQLVGLVGGDSNAFTSFDKTVYHETLPNNYTQMALWLEADRMSSFKVSASIFSTERLVVAEEWRLRQNQPYGTAFEKLLGTMFTKHPYHWTPIGNMDDLRAAAPGELQAFFNKYYVPNNAILVIAGGFDPAKTKEWVHQYFGWIPPGGVMPKTAPANGKPALPVIERHIPREPEQTAARRVEVNMKVPLPRIYLGYPMPPIRSEDQDALGLMLSILGDGQSSRLYRALVNSDSPLCVSAGSFEENLEDGGVMGAIATVMEGKDPAAVEKILRQQIAEMADKPVTPEELEKVKQQSRVQLAQRFETAEQVATELGDTLQMYGSLDRVKTARARLEAITLADIQRVAKTYFPDEKSTILIIKPGTPTAAQRAAETAPAPNSQPVATAKAKEIDFPKDYPTTPPMSGKVPAATFEKGVEKTIDGVRVIVMADHRIPIVNWSLTVRQGDYSEPVGKEGLGGLTARMVRRGPAGKSFNEFNEELDSKGIELNVADAGDNTSISGSCLKEQLPFAFDATHDILTKPAFDPTEFQRLKAMSENSLRLSLNNPQTVASRKLSHLLYGDSPIGRLSSLKSLGSITLDDVKQFYDSVYLANDAVLVISGDISVADGQAAAEKLLAGMKTGTLPSITYDFPPTTDKMRIILVDRPESLQSSIRMGIRAYDITSDEKFAGQLAGQMLSNGIDSRLGRYVRAEKGYVYGVYGYFSPGRHNGAFIGETDTQGETTAATIEAMFKVFQEMEDNAIPAKELADAKFRIAGQLLMAMQTIEEQATRRVDGILNGYPADYYDKYADRIAQVTAADVKNVMDKYVLDNRMTIVVVAPADAVLGVVKGEAPKTPVPTVREQLQKMGSVEVVPMPLAEK